MNVAETARKALDILDRDGWNKGFLTKPAFGLWDGASYREGSHCIGGAWNLAMHDSDGWSQYDSVYEKLAQVIRSQHPEYQEAGYCGTGHLHLHLLCFIAGWNNDPDTSEEDVRAVLEKLSAG